MSTGTVTRELEIEACLDLWLETLASLDPEAISELYAPDAVLLPTVSDNIAQTTNEITGYFRKFMLGEPQGRLITGTIRIMGDVAVHSGIYRFIMRAFEGQPELDARFTFVYQRIADEWKIVAHHSSTMPEG
jgi:uncharacterized protein (TIGR02246 family)